jgi:hypothetical protein
MFKPLYPLAVALAFACAGSVPDPTLSTTSGRSTTLTAAELASAHADVNTAYDAIARLRPNWLAAHGVTSAQNQGAGTEYAAVFVDGQHVGDVNALRNIQAFYIGEVRYYDVTQAGARFGIKAGSGGVIEVLSRAPGR